MLREKYKEQAPSRRLGEGVGGERFVMAAQEAAGGTCKSGLETAGRRTRRAALASLHTAAADALS